MSNTITPTFFYRTLNVEGLEFLSQAGPRDLPPFCLARLSVVFSYVPQSDSHACG